MMIYRQSVEVAMAAKGIATWYALAKAAGIPISTMYKYRAGVTPSMRNAVAIAKALGKTVESLCPNQ